MWCNSRLGLAFLLCAASGCDVERNPIETSEHPAVGLFTPGSTIGASDPTDMPMKMSLGNRCLALPAAPAGTAATEGMLTVTYTTQSLNVGYHPKNVNAVWVETPSGQFVDTVGLLANVRRPALVYFQDHTCPDALVDVKTGATLPTHDIEHTVTWDGLDFKKQPVADGQYKLYIEVTESDEDEPGVFATFDFTKGSSPFMVMPQLSADGALKHLSIVWMPMAGSILGGGAGAGAETAGMGAETAGMGAETAGMGAGAGGAGVAGAGGSAGAAGSASAGRGGAGAGGRSAGAGRGF